MHSVYQILAAILIGTSIGACLSKRDIVLMLGSLAGIALGVVALFLPSWPPLAVGAAVFLIAQTMQRDARTRA
ncbi:hypothetical protein [Castellaniella ginsengisoli]|uniref:Uncharacterized protein n=1 Tax=Castellaniella ginsengisoli TaxID=546114 RepID=A0AB39D742_9BURK